MTHRVLVDRALSGPDICIAEDPPPGPLTLTMLWLFLGALTLFLFLGGLRAFERASVTTIKSLLAWIAALGGISLALLLILTGREGIALGALVMFGPLIWQRWRAYRAATGTASNSSRRAARASRRPAARAA